MLQGLLGLLLALWVGSAREAWAGSAASQAVRSCPAFNASGTLMAFQEQGGERALRVRDWSTGDVREFQFSWPVSDPSFSPDGQFLYYLQMAQTGYSSELWRLRLGDGQSTRLTDLTAGDVTTYAVSPDGSQVALLAFRDDWDRQRLEKVVLSGGAPLLTTILGFGELGRDLFVPIAFLPDGNRVAFYSENRVYVVDLAAKKLLLKIDVPGAVHGFRLGSGSDAGVFSSMVSGTYQILSVDLDSGVLSQLTTSPTHKLFPSLDGAGHLDYLDCGGSIDAARFTSLSLACNRATGFRFFNNTWGRIGWSECYMLEFLVRAYEAFRDDYFLQELERHVDCILDATDAVTGMKDYAGVSDYGWSATRYSADHATPMRHAVQTAMVVDPLARFLELGRSDAHTSAHGASQLQRLESLLPRFKAAHEAEACDHENDPLAIAQEGEAYYRFPKGSPIATDGINLPFNQQDRFAAFLLDLDGLFPDPALLDRAIGIGRVFKRNLLPVANQHTWYYQWGKGFEGWSAAEDLSVNTPSSTGSQMMDKTYSWIEIDLAYRLRPFGIFTDDDYARFVETLLGNTENTFRPREFIVTGARLLDQVPARHDEIVGAMRNQDFLSEMDQYIPFQIPALTVLAGTEPMPSWSVVRRFPGGQEATLAQGEDLLAFRIADSGFFTLSKPPGGPFEVAPGFLPAYTVSAAAGAGGSLSPGGNSLVACGGNLTCTITPDLGFAVAGVTVDGASVGAVKSYPFDTVVAPHTIQATFKAMPDVTLTAAAGVGGTLSPTGVFSVKFGATQVFEISPSPGYGISKVTLDGISKGAVQTLSVTNIGKAHKVEAQFKALPGYWITTSVGTGGTISPGGNTFVLAGGSQAYTIMPSPGYAVAAVRADGTNVGTVKNYTFSRVVAPHTFAATFKAMPDVTLVATAGEGGTISPSGTFDVKFGASQGFTITPSSGYAIAKVTLDGLSKGAVSELNVTNIGKAHQVAVTFKAVTGVPASTSSSNPSLMVVPEGH